MNPKLFLFSIKNAFRRKSILLIAIVGTGLGTALMSTLISLSDGMDKRLNDSVNLVASDITVAAEDAPFGGGLIGGGTPLPVEYADTLRELEHVKFVKPSISTTLPKEVVDLGQPGGSFLAGVDLDVEEASEGPTTKIIAGRTIENDNELIIGRMAINQSKLGGNGIELGDKISVPLLSQRELMELQQQGGNPEEAEKMEFEIVGVYETGNAMQDGQLYGQIDQVRKVAKMDEGAVSSFRVIADDSENVEELSSAIENSLFDAEVPIQTSISKDLLGDLNETLDIFETFIVVIALVSAVAGGMSIFIIMLMSVMERLQEFGIFKATGWSNWNIISSVVLESLTVSIMGSLTGLGVGYGVGQIINNLLDTELTNVGPDLVVKVLGFGLTMGVIGGVLPAIKAARVSPIETLHSA